MVDSVEISRHRFADIADAEPDGTVAYAYVGVSYEIRLGRRLCRARRYDDTPEQASITYLPRRLRDRWAIGWRPVPYGVPSLRAAVMVLLGETSGVPAQIRVIHLLLRTGYVPVDSARALTA